MRDENLKAQFARIKQPLFDFWIASKIKAQGSSYPERIISNILKWKTLHLFIFSEMSYSEEKPIKHYNYTLYFSPALIVF